MVLTRTSDPFLKMIESNKTYGFTIAVKELRETVPNIFRYASAYKRLNNITSQGLWEMFVEPQPPSEETKPESEPGLPEEIMQSEPGQNTLPDIDPEAMEGEKYNMCHFWSNFEIAKLSWFRSKEYNDFFEMMDRSGGFWMERVSQLCPPSPATTFIHGLLLTRRSGATPLFTRSQPVPSWRRATSTTSETLATATRPSSTAPQMLPHGSCRTFRSLSLPLTMRSSAKRRMSTGPTLTSPWRTALAAAADVTPTLSRSKERTARVSPSGSILLAGGPAPRFVVEFWHIWNEICGDERLGIIEVAFDLVFFCLQHRVFVFRSCLARRDGNLTGDDGGTNTINCGKVRQSHGQGCYLYLLFLCLGVLLLWLVSAYMTYTASNTEQPILSSSIHSERSGGGGGAVLGQGIRKA